MNPITRAHLRAQASGPDAHAISIAPGDLLALLDATEWHPIGIAPQDRTKVLVYSKEVGYAIDWFHLTLSPLTGWLQGVTLWCPLPPPPAKGGNDARE